MNATHVSGAIETFYNGYRFRSRLEARWAVFFDAAKIEWRYEPEGYESNGVRYLPDFFPPAGQTWVEVKGSDGALQRDVERLVDVLDFCSPLPGIEDSYADDSTRGLLLLGEIPNASGAVLHPLIQHSKGLVLTWAAFFSCPGQPLLVAPQKRTWVASLLGVPAPEFCMESQHHVWTTKPVYLETGFHFPAVTDAYRAARQARFEHGECG